MKFNAKTILSIAFLFMCGICADGHAKSHKKDKEDKNKHKEVKKAEPAKNKTERKIIYQKPNDTQVINKADEVKLQPKEIVKIEKIHNPPSEIIKKSEVEATEKTLEITENTRDKSQNMSEIVHERANAVEIVETPVYEVKAEVVEVVETPAYEVNDEIVESPSYELQDEVTEFAEIADDYETNSQP